MYDDDAVWKVVGVVGATLLVASCGAAAACAVAVPVTVFVPSGERRQYLAKVFRRTFKVCALVAAGAFAEQEFPYWVDKLVGTG